MSSNARLVRSHIALLWNWRSVFRNTPRVLDGFLRHVWTHMCFAAMTHDPAHVVCTFLVPPPSRISSTPFFLTGEPTTAAETLLIARKKPPCGECFSERFAVFLGVSCLLVPYSSFLGDERV